MEHSSNGADAADVVEQSSADEDERVHLIGDGFSDLDSITGDLQDVGMVMPLSLCMLVLDESLDLLDQFDLFARQFPFEHSG